MYAAPPPPPPMYPPMPPPAPVPGASPGRRAIAWSLDFALIIAVACALGSWTASRISGLLSSAPALAGRGLWSALTSQGDLTSQDDLKGASADVALSIWNTMMGYIIQAFVLLALIVLIYQFAALAWKGRTLGKLAVDLRVESHARGGLPGKGQALVRGLAVTVTDVGLFALACCLLLEGAYIASVAAWVLSVVVFWANAVPGLFPGRRTVADRIAGTRVGRTQLMRAAAGQAAFVAQNAAQHASHHAARLAESDAAQRAQELGRSAAGRGREAAGKGREAAGEAAGKGREALGRARDAYRNRRALPDQADQPTQPALPDQPPPPAIAPPQPVRYPNQPVQYPQQPVQYPQQAPQPYSIPRPEDQH